MATRLFLLGPPRLIDGNGSHIRLPTRAYALAAVIALSSDHFVDRSVLAQLLWGDATTKFGSLRKLLWSLREAEDRAGVDLIEADDASVRLAQNGLTVDLSSIVALEAGRGALSLGEICRIYRGDLLEGLDLKSSTWDDWLQIQRAKLRALFIETMSREIETKLESEAQIKIMARRLIEIDPYNETACRRLINIYLHEGEKAQARKVYQNLAQRLRLDLKTEPAPETAQLMESLFVSNETSFPRPDTGESGRNLTGINPVMSKSGVPTMCLLMPTSAGRAGKLDLIAQSLIDDVTIGLCRTKLLRVLAPYTAWKISDISLRDQSLVDLGVDYAVETRVQKLADSTRLAIKLFKVNNREIIWAEHLAFELLDAAQRYQELSVRIMAAITSEVERTELRRYANAKNPTAYYWYLVGQHHLSQLDLPSLRRGRQALKSALAASENFVPAISAMARSYQLEWVLLSRGEESVLAKAEDLAKRAIELDSQDASGFRAFGACNVYLRRYDDSLAAYASAETLNPQHADMLADYADALSHASEIPLALLKIRQAIDLNPLCPDRYLWIEAGTQYFSENYLDAINSIKRMQNGNPALRLLAAAHAMAGHSQDASICVEQAMDVNPDFEVSRWMEIIPVRRKAQLRHYEYGLRSAGFQ